MTKNNNVKVASIKIGRVKIDFYDGTLFFKFLREIMNVNMEIQDDKKVDVKYTLPEVFRKISTSTISYLDNNPWIKVLARRA